MPVWNWNWNEEHYQNVVKERKERGMDEKDYPVLRNYKIDNWGFILSHPLIGQEVIYKGPTSIDAIQVKYLEGYYLLAHLSNKEIVVLSNVNSKHSSIVDRIERENLRIL